MPASIEVLAALTNLEDTPTEEQWNANPTAIRTKINELVGYLNKGSYDILTGFSEATTKGLVYMVNASQALILLEPDTSVNLQNFLFGFGTGVIGELQVGGVLEKTNVAPAVNKRLYLGVGGTLVEKPDRTAGNWIVPLAISETTGKIYCACVAAWLACQKVGSF